MSGDSPNAFTHEHVFDFKEGGRTSPVPTTSKDHQGTQGVTASVLVEPPQKDGEKKEDEPDFSSPTLNPNSGEKRHSIPDNTLELNEQKYEGDKREKEDENLLNNGGGLGAKVHPKPPKQGNEVEEREDDSCIVNCIYYTMECCKCSIL